MAKSFSDILDQSPETLEASVPLPAGEYVLQVKKAQIEELKFDFGDHKEGDENLMIYLTPIQAVEVDEDDLAQCEDWKNQLLSIRVFPEQMGDRFCDMKSERGFVYHCGLDPNDFEDVTALIAGTEGCQVLGTVVHNPNKNNPDRPYVNLKSTAPVE